MAALQDVVDALHLLLERMQEAKEKADTAWEATKEALEAAQNFFGDGAYLAACDEAYAEIEEIRRRLHRVDDSFQGAAAHIFALIGGQVGHPTALVGHTPSSDVGDAIQPNSEVHVRIETELASHPPLADVIVRLSNDHQVHPLNLGRDLDDPTRRDRTLALLKELADGDTLKNTSLETWLRDNPGSGPIFEQVDSNVNQNREGDSRKQKFVDDCKRSYPERAVGNKPTPEEHRAVEDYASDLMNKVEPEVEQEIAELCPPDAIYNVRTKNADGLHDKVRRMTDSGRSSYEIGDVIDAVGARITVEDMPQLASVLSNVEQRFGTGDGGRILEIENMYASPKSRSPEYRVIPITVRVDVEGKPYTYELQLTTRRASVAADVGHNTIYKRYHELTDAQRETIKKMQSEAAALDQKETRR